MILAPLALLTLSPLPAAQQAAIQIDWIQNPASGRFVGLERELRSWTEAESVAVSLGGHLATVRNQQEQDFLEQNLIPLLRNDRGMWLGANDIAVEGVWTWVSGEPWGGYTNWLGNQPDNFGGVEDYGHMWGPVNPFGNPSGVWNDYSLFAGNGDPGASGAIEVDALPSKGWTWPRPLIAGEVSRVIAFDKDADGDLDLAATLSGAGGVAILENDGVGGLTLHATIPGLGVPAGLAALDIDEDGDADLLVADPSGQNLWRLDNSDGVGGQWSAIVELTGHDFIDVATLDADGIGNEPGFVAVARTSPVNLVVYRRMLPGVLTKTYATAISPGAHSVVAGDMDGDGSDDALITGNSGGTGTITLLRAAGQLSFVQSFSTGSNPPGQPSLGDVDGDGDLDALVSFTLNDTFRLWVNDGLGTFTPGLLSAAQQSGQGAYGTGLLDADGDGDLDFLVACAGDGEVRVHLNTGTGATAGYESFDEQAAPRRLLVADLDGPFTAPDFVTISSATPSAAGGLTSRLSGRFDDCDGDGVPDGDAVASGAGRDCNGNGVLDYCDVYLAGTSNDCNQNGIPDECDVLDPLQDCDGNGSIDFCELNGQSDCDQNGILDICQILDGTSEDCNDNGITDWCEYYWDLNDCDLNGEIDSCEISVNPSLDCNGDDELDSCQIQWSSTWDQNANGVVDSCECSVTNYCAAQSNSSGNIATMSASGLPSQIVNDFTLEAQGTPSQKFGMFLYGRNESFVFVGDGALCVQAPIYRISPLLLTTAAGTASAPLDLTAPPFSSGPGQVNPGETWHFQLWFRDPAGGFAGFNFSDGLRVTFCP